MNDFDPVQYIRDQLDELGLTRLGLFYGDYNPAGFPGVQLAEVESEGGFEGGGESVHHVIQITHEGKDYFVHNTGCYHSYQGVEMDDNFTRVYPHPVMRVEYTTEPNTQ